VLYRGINKDLSPIMKAKYDSYETAFAVGTKLTFPAPTACSTSDMVAGQFMNGIQLVIQNAGGVALLPGQLSAYDESEVMLPFPSSFKVVARSKVQETVVVVIEAIFTPFSYCSAPEVHVVSAAAAAHATPLPPTAAVTGGMVIMSPPAAPGRPLSDLSVLDVALIVCAAADVVSHAHHTRVAGGMPWTGVRRLLRSHRRQQLRRKCHRHA
jgi:hypothetical protein